ncbi:DEAD/DEAH box helicase [Nesterenkonia xinjiangensis]|uniref:Superfamily II DNA/RNA helicase n=1 Tax=Nesterenkonia xinjiangensis TaxID=225327 RepID=A0A7Z0GLN8_9MICC|nr:DEAD/DEAH box helicase [Nesterenkonia xinjiangensis]NYJ77769.1 superfamily II DNA/RNA helicase [Nesterenkonia xinjiangensis]
MSHTTFTELGVPAPIVKTLAADGKFTAFPIQQDTLPDTLTGRDVLGRGKTGSGKTLAFAIPMIARLGESDGARRRARRPRGLVLAPTRELATQIDAVLQPLAAAYGMRTTTIYGGISQKRQVDALNGGVDIVVACPGRLEDLLQQQALSLDAVEVTVLDEADHMADLGFLPGVTRILKKTPEHGQRMFFSATLDNGVDKLVRQFLHNEILHSVDDPTSHVSAMTHHVFEVDPDDKKTLVQQLASGTGRRILFTRTKHQAKKLAKQLTSQGVPAVDLHGNLSQNQRDRNLASFGQGGVRVLVATDVAARGVHVDGIELVVHVDPPAEHKAYLHRSGRTARAGSAGDVVTVMLPEQRRDTQTLLKKAAIKVTPQAVSPNSEAVSALVGEVAEHVEPQAHPQGGGQQPSRRGGGSNNAGRGRGRSGGGSGRGPARGGRRDGGTRGGDADSRGSRGQGSTRRSAAPQRSESGPASRPAAARRGPRRASAPAGTPGSR